MKLLIFLLKSTLSFITRFNHEEPLLYDPEIEKTTKSLRKQSKQRKQMQPQDPRTEGDSETPKTKVASKSMAQECTMRELASPPTNQQPLYITCLNLDIPFKLKSSLIHLFPKFKGLENENPHKRLKEFYVVCSIMKPQGDSER